MPLNMGHVPKAYAAQMRESCQKLQDAITVMLDNDTELTRKNTANALAECRAISSLLFPAIDGDPIEYYKRSIELMEHFRKQFANAE